jgi:hypothetical protein
MLYGASVNKIIKNNRVMDASVVLDVKLARKTDYRGFFMVLAHATLMISKFVCEIKSVLLKFLIDKGLTFFLIDVNLVPNGRGLFVRLVYNISTDWDSMYYMRRHSSDRAKKVFGNRLGLRWYKWVGKFLLYLGVQIRVQGRP